MRYFEPNQQGTDYVTGDIHGQFHRLQTALDAIGFNPQVDRLFAVGDLVDRGPNSEEVLEWLAWPYFFSIMGNHERMIIDYYEETNAEPDWIMLHNGAEWFLELSKQEQAPYVRAFKQLPQRIQVGNTGIIHAEAPEDWLVPDPEYTSLWSRQRIQYKDVKGTKNIEKVYLGHTPTRTRTTLGNNIYIDTASSDLGAGPFTIERIW